MGKIYEALQKSKEKHNVSVAVDEADDTAIDAWGDKEGYVKQSNSLYKDVRVLDVPRNPLKKMQDIKQTDQRTSFARTDVIYGDNQIDKNMVALLKPQSFEAEQFKILRTNLLFPSSGKSPRTIMVTSAIPSEGKSTIAANLAISIAQGIQEYVLLIDCDIRRPRVHTQFGYGDVPGLSDYLSKGTPLSSLLLKTKLNKLLFYADFAHFKYYGNSISGCKYVAIFRI